MDIIGALVAMAAEARQSERTSVFEEAAALGGATACDGAVATHDCWAPPMDVIEAVATVGQPGRAALFEGAAASGEAAVFVGTVPAPGC